MKKQEEKNENRILIKGLLQKCIMVFVLYILFWIPYTRFVQSHSDRGIKGSAPANTLHQESPQQIIYCTATIKTCIYKH